MDPHHGAAEPTGGLCGHPKNTLLGKEEETLEASALSRSLRGISTDQCGKRRPRPTGTIRGSTADQGAVAGQAAFYVELTRARDNAVLLTDDRIGLVEALETATGEELSALEAIGHQFQDPAPEITVLAKEEIPPEALNDAQAWREEVRATCERHLDRRLAEREALLDRARSLSMEGNPALVGVDGHDAWREQTLATIETWRDETEEEPGTGAAKADLLERLVAFDDSRAEFNRDRQRHAQTARAAGEDFALHPGIDDLVARGRTLVETAPRAQDVPWDLPSFLDLVTGTRRDHDEELARAEAEVLVRFERTVRDLDDVKDARRALRDLAKGEPLHAVAGYAAWREQADAAIDALQRAAVQDGERERLGLADTLRLDEAFRHDDEVASLMADWAIFEKEARARGVEAVDLAASDPLLTRTRHLAGNPPEGETAPQALTGILARHQARAEERDRAAATITRSLDGYRACHQDTADPLSAIGEWRGTTKEAIGTWRAMTEPDGRDPALAATAAVLEDLIAFEGRVHDVAARLRNARGDDGTGNPFIGKGGDALAADLRELQADLPGRGMMLSSLQQASQELEDHERALARKEERQRAAAAVARAFDDHAARHGRHCDRPSAQARSIRAWCDEARQTLDAWRAVTAANEQEPALSKDAAALVDLVAFEERALDLHARLHDARRAGGAARPFLAEGGDTLAADLRSLEARLPRHGDLLSSLREASQALDRHEARIAERENAAARIDRALDEYRACHAPSQDTAEQLSGLRLWRHETQEVVDAWRSMAETGENDPGLSQTAKVLEDLIAFEDRARDLFMRWSIARIAGGTTSPFRGADGDALAAELRALEAGRPRHAILLQGLRPAFESLAEHERAVARTRELLERVSEIDEARRSLLEREGRKSRPLNRRFNKAWRRWHDAAEAVVADIDAADGALIARVDEQGMAARVRAEFAASDRLDGLPGWLLLRLHDNAVNAGTAMHPAMTDDYAGIIAGMGRFDDSLPRKDSRRRVLVGEINRYHAIQETRLNVAKLLGDLQAHNAEAASLDEAAGTEELPLQQSMAWAEWHTLSHRLEDEARAVLNGGGDHRLVLHDGQGTRRAFEEAMARFEETRTARGEPDNTARLERLRQEAEERRRSWSRKRGGGLSM